MHIGIIGSGNIGATTAGLFVAAGHDVAIANSRGPESLSDVVSALGEHARAATVEDAASTADLVLVAIPFGRFRELPADALRDKIVVDAMNYFSGRDGHIPELDDDTTTSTELVAAHAPEARLVKAFNTMQAAVLRERGSDGPSDERLALFVAGDDEEAKARVSDLIEEVGFAAIDTGSLADGGRRQQPGSPLFVNVMTGSEARDALAKAPR